MQYRKSVRANRLLPRADIVPAAGPDVGKPLGASTLCGSYWMSPQLVTVPLAQSACRPAGRLRLRRPGTPGPVVGHARRHRLLPGDLLLGQGARTLRKTVRTGRLRVWRRPGTAPALHRAPP